MYDIKNLNHQQLSYLKKQFHLKSIFIKCDMLFFKYHKYTLVVSLYDELKIYAGTLINNTPYTFCFDTTINKSISTLLQACKLLDSGYEITKRF